MSSRDAQPAPKAAKQSTKRRARPEQARDSGAKGAPSGEASKPSEASDQARDASDAEPRKPSSSKPSTGQALDRWFELALARRHLAPPIVLLIALGVGYWLGLGAALLVLAGSVLLLVIGLLWASVQSLTGESDLNLEEALSLAAPSAEEEQKRAVLRALKDLDYELRIGKVSQEDYDELSQRYRAEAKRLLQRLAEVEVEAKAAARRRLEARLEAHGLLSQVQGATARAIASAASDPEDSPPDSGAGSESDTEGTDGDATSDPEDSSADSGADAARGTDSDARDSAGTESDTDSASKAPSVSKPDDTAGPSRRCPECERRSPLSASQCQHCEHPLASPGERLCRGCPATYSASEPVCPVCGVETDDA